MIVDAWATYEAYINTFETAFDSFQDGLAAIKYCILTGAMYFIMKHFY
jgi:cytochrome c peroxidase